MRVPDGAREAKPTQAESQAWAAGVGFGAVFERARGAFAGGPATPGDVGVARADAAEPSPGISPETYRPVEAVDERQRPP